MCSFAIRETGIGRVVYAIRSQVMGGHSRWSILDDDQLNRAMPELFRAAAGDRRGFLRHGS